LIHNPNASRIPCAADFTQSGAALVERGTLPQRMEEAAFSAFYHETGPKLWSYIRRTSGDAALADDLLQETFFRFLRADLPLMDRLQSRAYLYRIASSLITDHWRRLKRERRRSLDWSFRNDACVKPETGTDEMRVFERLKIQEQTLLWMAYVEGFDHREIAAALQLQEKSVRVLLFRARKRLAALVGKKEVSPGEGI
jgi:RNA polymerase sigma-70 factor, ECF subfamily